MWFAELWSDAKIILACVGITVTVVGYVAAAVLPRRRLHLLVVLIFGMSVIGTVAGLAGGTSRVGVVGDIIPAALTFVGLASVYLFGIKISRGVFASFAAAAFALSLGLGYAAGAGKRGQIDAFHDSLAYCQDMFSDADVITDARGFLIQASFFGEECVKIMAAGFAMAKTSASRDSSGAAEAEILLSLQNGIANAVDNAVATLEIAMQKDN